MNATATAILGIPVDNLSMEGTVSGILEMIDRYAFDRRPRYVATINLDFITSVHSWRMGNPRHPELLHILRKADMVTADGMPIVWAARWLGAPLPMRVAGSDLVPRLAEAAADNGKSIYFLGGKRFEMTALRATRALKKRLPALKVAGVDAPWVHTSGEALAQAEAEDNRIVERINAAAPDILLIAFGSPKQEIWFDRNRHRLKVPVSIGVGATFDFLAGTASRAPRWMQRSGLEWLFRLRQEPKRLWKRYLIDFLKFGGLIWPSIISHWLEALKLKLHRKNGARIRRQAAVCDGDMLALPNHLNAAAVAVLPDLFQTKSEISLDFTNVKVIDTGGVGTLARTFQRAEADGNALKLNGMARAHRRFLYRNALADYFNSSIYRSFSYRVEYLPEEIVLLRFSGILDTRRTVELNFRKLLEDVGPRDCIFDLTDLTYIGSSGLMLMLNISKYILSGGNCFVLCAPRKNVGQMFRMTDLKRLFVILPEAGAAVSFIHDVRGEGTS